MYVGIRKRGMGRLAGTHRLSGLRGLRRRLGQDDPFYDTETGTVYSGSTPAPSSSPTYSIFGPTAYPVSAAPIAGTSAPGISTLDAGLLNNLISTAGGVAARAVSPTPSVSVGPGGVITATGGAQIPTSLLTDTTITSYLPILLLAGGAYLIISLMKR